MTGYLKQKVEEFEIDTVEEYKALEEEIME